MFDDLNEKKRDLLIEIKVLYGLNQDLSRQVEDYFQCNSDSDYEKKTCYLEILQKHFVDFILNDKILSIYKPFWKYRKLVLKKVINIFEKNSFEINDIIYDSYIQIINDPECDSNKGDQKYFIVYFSKTNILKTPIIIEQFASAITNGTTGLYVWPACFQLIDYLEKNREFLCEKTILELGAGVGLLGLHCLRTKSIKHYTFTDCHSMVLKQIETNVLLNYEEKIVNTLQNLDNNTINDKLISIQDLNWLDLSDCKLFENKINKNLDIILATDIIFDPELMPALSKTLSFIWSNQIDSKNLIFLIASTIRNESTYQIFKDNLNKEKFKYEVLEKNYANTKSSTPDCLIEILKIFK